MGSWTDLDWLQVGFHVIDTVDILKVPQSSTPNMF